MEREAGGVGGGLWWLLLVATLVLLEEDVEVGEDVEDGDDRRGSLLPLFLMWPKFGVPMFLSEGEERNLSKDELTLE